MRRVALTVSYLGAAYCGWQVQPNGPTVQAALQDALTSVLGARPDLTGASRTDAGVHARGFVCHFDTDSAIPDETLPDALNFYLPRDISVRAAKTVAPDFHARYSALGKRYEYLILNAPRRDPFFEGRALHVKSPLDEEILDRAAAAFVGTHDFSAFRSAGSDVIDSVRTVRRAEVRREGELVVFRCEADGFLYNMVRIMAGTLLEIARGRILALALCDIIKKGDRSLAGPTAPAHGLYLDRIFYGDW